MVLPMLIRTYVCIECDPDRLHETEAARGQLPVRCPEHKKIQFQRLMKKYFDKKQRLGELS